MLQYFAFRKILSSLRTMYVDIEYSIPVWLLVWNRYRRSDQNIIIVNGYSFQVILIVL